MGHCLVLSMDQGWGQAPGLGSGSLPEHYLHLAFLMANCLTAGTTAVLWTSATHIRHSLMGFFLAVVSLKFYGFQCVFSKGWSPGTDPRCLAVLSCPHHHSKHCKTAMICQPGDQKKCFLPSFEDFRVCSAPFFIFHTCLNNNWNYCLVWDLRSFGSDHSGCSKVLNVHSEVN